jgi:hypothetical protein
MSHMPRLAEYFSKPLGYYADSDLECYFTSTNWALALEDVSPGDILEIQAVDEVAERDVVENNILSRRDSGRY